MVLNKKGVFFTLLAMVIIAIFVLTLAFFSGSLDRRATQSRVETLNNFVLATEEDFSRMLFINGFRTIFLIENSILESGQFRSGINNDFQGAFFNGNFDGEAEDLLVGTTLAEIETKLNNRALRIGANVDLDEDNAFLAVDQVDPWNVRFALTIGFEVSDTTGLAKWERNAQIIAFVPIESFSDPLYLVGAGPSAVNKFVQSPYPSSGFPTGLADHLDNSYYVANTDAPSFLGRLQGFTGEEANGVESLVDLGDLPSGVTPLQKSVVDHIYFSTDNPINCWVSGYGDLYLDSGHESFYGVAC